MYSYVLMCCVVYTNYRTMRSNTTVFYTRYHCALVTSSNSSTIAVHYCPQCSVLVLYGHGQLRFNYVLKILISDLPNNITRTPCVIGSDLPWRAYFHTLYSTTVYITDKTHVTFPALCVGKD